MFSWDLINNNMATLKSSGYLGVGCAKLGYPTRFSGSEMAAVVRMTMLPFGISDWADTHLNVELGGHGFVVAELIARVVLVGKLVDFERHVLVVVGVYPVEDSVAPGWPSSGGKRRYFFEGFYKKVYY